MSLSFVPGEKKDLGHILRCPKCMGGKIVLDKVEVFETELEDAKGLHVHIRKGIVATGLHTPEDSKDQRNGIEIEFDCKKCKARSCLVITDHDDSTYFNIVEI